MSQLVGRVNKCEKEKKMKIDACNFSAHGGTTGGKITYMRGYNIAYKYML